MLIDFPGVMTDFSKVLPGEFFIYIEEGKTACGMKIFDAASQKLDPESQVKVGVLSFSAAAHLSMTPPTILETQFQNRTVCVVRAVVIRLPFQANVLRSGSPSMDRPGTVIIAVGGTFIRGYDRTGCKDVNLSSGAVEQSRAHPGSVWLDNWEIILPLESGAHRLCERGNPAATGPT